MKAVIVLEIDLGKEVTAETSGVDEIAVRLKDSVVISPKDGGLVNWYVAYDSGPDGPATRIMAAVKA